MDLPITVEFLDGLGIVSVCVLVLLAVIYNKGLTLNSRVTDRDHIIAKQDETIEWQRQSMDAKDQTIADLTRAVHMAGMGFQKVGQAAEQIAGGEH